jgi:ATP-dependent Clp protease ATP-binding subunit ClpB
MLTKEHLRQIVDIQLNDLTARLKDRNITVEFTDAARSQLMDEEFTDAARSQLMDEGYDVAYGARPLKRVIQQRLENKLATEIIGGKFTEGDTIKIDGTGQMFTFEKV